MITPYDKNLMSVIERAILKSDLGINPTNDGVNIRLIFPPMTEERRKEMVKQVNARTEQGCVAVRNVRHHAMEHIKAAKDRVPPGESALFALKENAALPKDVSDEIARWSSRYAVARK